MSFRTNRIVAFASSMWRVYFLATLLVSQNSSSRPYCYYYFDVPKPFVDADIFCQSFGGQLASISNLFEATQIWENTQGEGVSRTAASWLGATDVEQNGRYSWLDGTPFAYSRWGNSQPDVSNQCLSLNKSDGKWYSADCMSALGFTCMSPLNNNSVPPCESGWAWLESSNSCYKVILGLNTMQDGESKCQAMSAHLTSIHTDAENTFVNTFGMAGITIDDFGMVYIGLRNNNDVFEWTDGTAFDYSHWAEGEPNNKNGVELCVETFADPSTNYPLGDYHQKWNDFTCDRIRAGVCKKPARN